MYDLALSTTLTKNCLASQGDVIGNLRESYLEWKYTYAITIQSVIIHLIIP